MSQITHYAPIKSFAPHKNEPKKYEFKLGEPIKLDQPITLSEYNRSGLQRGVYTTLEHLKNSKHIDELKDWWHQ